MKKRYRLVIHLIYSDQTLTGEMFSTEKPTGGIWFKNEDDVFIYLNHLDIMVPASMFSDDVYDGDPTLVCFGKNLSSSMKEALPSNIKETLMNKYDFNLDVRLDDLL